MKESSERAKVVSVNEPKSSQNHIKSPRGESLKLLANIAFI